MVYRMNMDVDSIPSDSTINRYLVINIDLINVVVFFTSNGSVLSVNAIFFITNLYYNMNNLN